MYDMIDRWVDRQEDIRGITISLSTLKMGDIKASSARKNNSKLWAWEYIEDIQVFGVNMSFISLSEVKKIYIS